MNNHPNLKTHFYPKDEKPRMIEPAYSLLSPFTNRPSPQENSADYLSSVLLRALTEPCVHGSVMNVWDHCREREKALQNLLHKVEKDKTYAIVVVKTQGRECMIKC